MGFVFHVARRRWRSSKRCLSLLPTWVVRAVGLVGVVVVIAVVACVGGGEGETNPIIVEVVGRRSENGTRTSLEENESPPRLMDDDPWVRDMLRTKYLVPPSPLPYNLSTDPFYKRRAVRYGWSFVNDILRDIFSDEYLKFFVEAGGLDGEFLSNTLWLEQEKNWTGLVVEPEKRNFRDMVDKRRKCWISHSCLSSYNYVTNVTMLSTERKKGESIDEEIIRGGTHQIGSHLNPAGYSLFEQKLSLRRFESQCFPLYAFLLALNQTVIDFLSLDLQGPEVQIFNTLPLDKLYIRTLVIEHETKTFDDDLIKTMNNKGFNILSIGGSPDYFFINAKEKELLDRYKGTYLQKHLDDGIQIVIA